MMAPTIILMADQTVNDEAKSLCSVGSHRMWGDPHLHQTSALLWLL